MKKKYIFMFIIVFISLILIVPSIVKADGRTMKICEYTVSYKKSTRSVKVYYYVDSATKWNLYYETSGGGSETKNGIFSKVFSNSNPSPHVYFDGDGLKTNIENYKSCPKYVFLDYNGIDELCFSKDKNSSFCESKVGSGDMDNIGEAKWLLKDDLEPLKDQLLTSYTNAFTNKLYLSDLTQDNAGEILRQEFLNSVQEKSLEEYKTFFKVEELDVVPNGLIEAAKSLNEEIVDSFMSENAPKIIEEYVSLGDNYDTPENPFYTEEEIEENKTKIENNINIILGEMESGSWITAEDIEELLKDLDHNISYATCESLLGDPTDNVNQPPAYYLSVVFKVLKYVAIVLLIVLSIMDFIGAVSSQDNDVLKKTVSKVIMRAIMCVIIFLLPTLIEFILKYIHDGQISTCINTK